MKPFLNKFLKKFSQLRDWLLVALAIGGIFFFMQKGQAIREQDPIGVWQDKYEQIIGPAPMADPSMMGGEGASQAGGAVTDIFKPVQLGEIEAVSTNPFFTPAEEYNRLRQRLEALRKDYTEAIAQGDPRVAIEKLTQYVKDDPKGRILEWPNPPSTILANLVCEETSKALAQAIEEARTVSTTLSQDNLTQLIEQLGQILESLNRAIAEAEANTHCTDGGTAESRITEAKDFSQNLQTDKNNLHVRLLTQDFDALVRDGGSIDANTPAETVAELAQRVRTFRDLATSLDPGNEIVNEQKQERLKEIEARVEAQKEARVAQVRQRIGALSAVEGYETNKEALDEILKNYDILEMLGDTRAATDRRTFEGHLSKLEAAQTVAEIGKLLDSIEAGIEQIDKMATANEDYSEALKGVEDTFAKVEEMGRKPLVRRAPGIRDQTNRLNKLKRLWVQRKGRLRQE